MTSAGRWVGNGAGREICGGLKIKGVKNLADPLVEFTIQIQKCKLNHEDLLSFHIQSSCHHESAPSSPLPPYRTC